MKTFPACIYTNHMKPMICWLNKHLSLAKCLPSILCYIQFVLLIFWILIKDYTCQSASQHIYHDSMYWYPECHPYQRCQHIGYFLACTCQHWGMLTSPKQNFIMLEKHIKMPLYHERTYNNNVNNAFTVMFSLK